MDICYTSIPLGKKLYEKNITCVGTFQMNRKSLPIEMKKTKDHEKFCWMSCEKDNGPVFLNWYVVKTKSAEKRNVLLLQTTNVAPYVTKDAKKSP